MIKLKDGYTLMHEHLTIDLMPGDLGGTDFDTLCRELTELYTFGVRNIVDITNQGMGRKPDVLRNLASATGSYPPPAIILKPVYRRISGRAR